MDILGVPDPISSISIGNLGRVGVVTPESFGAVGDGVADDSSALASACDAGKVVLVYNDYAISEPLIVPPGVRLIGPGGYQRDVGSGAATKGGVIRPAATFTGDCLIQLGAVGGVTNPHGAILDGITVVGATSVGTQPTNLVGIYARDTRDVKIINCFVSKIDRPTNTGRGIVIEGSTTSSAFGATIIDTLVSECFEGILVIGDGSTDQRLSDLLITGCTRSISLGIDDRSGSTVQAGGGGTQFTNSHLTYAGMPSGGWHLQLGSQAGDGIFTNIYFDQSGNTYPVRVGNAKNLFTACHFLPSSVNSREGLVRCTVGGTQQLSVVNCNTNLNGSSVKSLLWYSAKSGTPTGGVISGNTTYGTGAAWVSTAIDSAQAAISDTDNGAFYLDGNVRCV